MKGTSYGTEITKDDIIKMIKETGWEVGTGNDTDEYLERAAFDINAMQKQINELKSLLVVERLLRKRLNKKLQRVIRDKKRYKRKLDTLRTDYYMLEDALENSDNWAEYFRKELEKHESRIS